MRKPSQVLLARVTAVSTTLKRRFTNMTVEQVLMLTHEIIEAEDRAVEEVSE